MSIDKNKIEEILKKLWKEDDGIVSIERISYNKALQKIQYEIDKLEIKENSVSASSKSNQPSKKMPTWKHWKDDIDGNGEGKPIYLTKVGNTYSLTSCLGFECDYIELSELDKLLSEKQGEQNHNSKKWIYEDVYLKEREQLYQDGINEVLENPQKYGFEKSVDKDIIKTKPKFKVGDWITNSEGHSFHIWAIGETRYFFDGHTHEKLSWELIKNVDEHYALWCLEDARDGDILVRNIFNTIDDFDYIFIYNKTSNLRAYCYYSKKKGSVCVEDRSHCCPWSMTNIKPATKEQRDFLTKKMIESGYGHWMVRIK